MKQHEAVIEAMRQMGGYATLAQLYHAAVRFPGSEWKTKTPFASIRRIVQTNPEFFKIRPGLWALVSERARVLQELGVSERPSARAQDFDHSYYQGLIVELGNPKGCETFIPNQDKNKPFLRQKLAEIASLRDYYDFTYEHLLHSARTVDVTWFNSRKMPKAFFEVECVTDMHNSLLKFVAFQDFLIKFFIVADEVRQRQFEDRMRHPAFAPIVGRVRFLDFGALSKMHSGFEARNLEKQLGL